MNNLYPEKLTELQRRKIQEEMDAIRLEEEAAKGQPKWLDRNLAALGNWMVAGGEKLRKRHSASRQQGSADLLRGAAR